MASFRIRSFQGRIFLAILLVVLVPGAVAVTAGVVTLRGIGTRSGTLGAWDAVAESGRTLLESLDSAAVDDPAVREAAQAHREALSASVRLSRLYAFVAERFLTVLPLAALASGILVVALALLTARWLSAGFARPITQLAGWTRLIAREEPLPEATPHEASEVEEIRTLRAALRSMADDLEEGRRRAVENARMRSWTELARRVAHEIKNPLTPMRMAAATLGRDREGAEAEAARALTEEIARLDEMARTFSQYGRVPEGPRSDVDLKELLESLARQHATETAPVRVEGPAVTVSAHYDALERAFRNLILNAVEAQEGDARSPSVRVSVGLDGDWAEVRVEDAGPGIPEELLNSVWNPDVTTKRSGTGLGLAIVRQTMAHHGGTVSVENAPRGGAAFTVRLPEARAAGA